MRFPTFSSYRSKLQASLLGLGLAATALTGWEASSGASAALRQATFDRLTAIRQARVRHLERYFQDLGSHVLALSSDDSVLRALTEFDAAWNQTPPAQPNGPQARELRHYYQAFGAAGAQWFPANGRTIALQHLFLAANPHPLGSKDRLLDPPGPYGKVHARYHPTLHRYQNAFGFYDIFLIDAAEARVLYTVFKEPDLGMPLRESPYRESGLGEIFRRAMELTETEQFVLGDYTKYVPSHSAPAAFAAAPIWRAGSKAGVLAIQVSIREINRVMTADGNWRAEGLGETGQTYIVGPDNTLRSDMRFRIEHPERYHEALLRAGTPQPIAGEIREHGTAILRLPVAPDAARYRTVAAGTGQGIDSRGVAVLRSHSPLSLPGIQWALMAEIDEQEAFAPVRALRNRILGFGVMIAAGCVVAAALLARSVTQPVLALAEGVRRLSGRRFDVNLPVSSTDELGQLAGSFNRMARQLEETTVSKEELQQLAGRLITAQEDERRRVARELHDDFTQRLAAVAIDAGNVARMSDGDPAALRAGAERLKQQMAQLSADVHRLSRSLHPALLDDLGLEAALEAECRAFFERGGPPVDLECEGPLDRLPAAARLAFYRIVQEALRNAQRHAAAGHLDVRLAATAEGASLSIRDDGRGFDRSSPDWRPGLGLASMEERVRLLSGTLEIQSAPGAGTAIQVWLPAQPEEAAKLDAT